MIMNNAYIFWFCARNSTEAGSNSSALVIYFVHISFDLHKQMLYVFVKNHFSDIDVYPVLKRKQMEQILFVIKCDIFRLFIICI